jgi:hypothetical protein
MIEVPLGAFRDRPDAKTGTPEGMMAVSAKSLPRNNWFFELSFGARALINTFLQPYEEKSDFSVSGWTSSDHDSASFTESSPIGLSSSR